MNAQKHDKKHNKKPVNFVSAGSATMLTSMIIAGFLLGYLTDYLLDTLPIFLITFGILGFVGGMVRVKDLIVAQDQSNKQQKERK